MNKYKVIILSFGIKILGVGSSLALSAVLARALGAHDFGLYTLIMSVLAIASMPLQNGLPGLLVRETAAYKALNKKNKVIALWRWSDVVAIKLSFIVGFCIAFFVAYRALVTLDARSQLYMWILPLFPVLGIMAIKSAALRGVKRIVAGQVGPAVIRPLSATFLIAFAMFYGDGSLSINAAFLLYFFASLISLLIVYLFFIKERKAISFDELDFTDKRKWINSLIPLSLVGGVQVVNSNLDVIMLGYLSQEMEVAFYRVGVVGAGFIILGMQVLGVVISPYLSQYYSKNDMRNFKKIYSLSSLAMFCFGLVAFCAAYLLGDTFIEIIYGASYGGAYQILLILGFGQLISAAAGMVGLALNVIKQEKIVLKAVILSLVFNFIFGLVLIPLYGGIGAAISTSLSLLIWNSCLYMALRRKIDGFGIGYD